MKAALEKNLTNQANIANLKVSIEQLYRMVGQLQEALQRAENKIIFLEGKPK